MLGKATATTPTLDAVTDRAAIVDVDLVLEQDDAMVTITLDWQGTPHRGAAVGSSDPREHPRLVGEAVLRAVESLAEDRLRMELLAIATTPVGDARVAVAQVRVEPVDEVLVGSALIRDDDAAWAAGRAVMDALNRRLGALL
jgi:hypothetical protein